MRWKRSNLKRKVFFKKSLDSSATGSKDRRRTIQRKYNSAINLECSFRCSGYSHQNQGLLKEVPE